MKRLVLLLASLSLLGSAEAQTDSTQAPRPASHTAIKDFEHLRPIGETRRWDFMNRDSTVGTYTSQVTGTKDIDGREAFVLSRRMRLKTGTGGKVQVSSLSGEHYISSTGSYLGDRSTMTVDGRSFETDMLRRGDSLVGYVVREGNRLDQQYYLDFREPILAFDERHVDEIELYLAMRDFAVGDTLRDTLLLPGLLTKMQLLATVTDYKAMTRWDGIVDSAFVIRVSHPQSQVWYFAKSQQLLGATFQGQGGYARLASVSSPLSNIQSGLTIRRLIKLVPACLVFLAVGLVAALLMVGAGLHLGRAYLAMAAGAAIFLLMPWTQTPLQTMLFEKLLVPRVSAGGSPYLWGIAPSLAGGFLQELAKLVVVLILVRQFNVRRSNLVTVATAVALGFGFFEACYLSAYISEQTLYSWAILERTFFVVFHVAAGGLLGMAIWRGGGERLAGTVVLLILVNALLRYLPVFVQQKAVTVEMMYFIMPLVVLAMLTLSLTAIRRANA